MTLKNLAQTLNISKKTLESKASEILLLSELRRIETEIFSLTEKYGVKSLKEMDNLIAKGKLSEERVSEDFFKFDFLLERKNGVEKLLKSYKEKLDPWAVITSFKGLPRLNLGR